MSEKNGLCLCGHWDYDHEGRCEQQVSSYGTPFERCQCDQFRYNGPGTRALYPKVKMRDFNELCVCGHWPEEHNGKIEEPFDHVEGHCTEPMEDWTGPFGKCDCIRYQKRDPQKTFEEQRNAYYARFLLVKDFLPKEGDAVEVRQIGKKWKKTKVVRIDDFGLFWCATWWESICGHSTAHEYVDVRKL